MKDPYGGPGWGGFPGIEVFGGRGGVVGEVGDLEEICTGWDEVYVGGAS